MTLQLRERRAVMDKQKQPKPQGQQSESPAQMPLGMLKKHIDAASVAGKLRDRKKFMDEKIKAAGG